MRKRSGRLFTGLLTAVLLTGCISPAVAVSAAEQDGSAEWTVTAEENAMKGHIVGEAEFWIDDGVLVSYEGRGGDVVIPSSVRRIDDIGSNKVTSITIPSSVTDITYGAFSGCSSLTDIIVEEDNTSYQSVDGILYNAAGTTLICCPVGKTSADLLESVEYLAEEAFSGCSGLTEIAIPSGVTEIGENAFRNCSGLTEIEIPSGVTEIGENAFRNCSGLTEITIPSGVTKIGKNAFEGCSGLENIIVEEGNWVYRTIEGILYNLDGTTLIYCPVGKKDVTIPEGVKNIGDYAFSDCSNLTSIAIPSSVTSIGVRAFSDCSNLTSITIPSSVTSIGSRAFADCSSLTEITIPFSVTCIESGTFFNCSKLTEITIPSNVTSIGDGAFKGCSALERVAIPEGVMSIGSSAFWSCSVLTEVMIPSSVTSIGAGLDGTFGGCDRLNKIEVDKANTVYASKDGILYNKDENILIRCPEGKEGSADISLCVTNIEECAFRGCDKLTKIMLPESVISIGDFAFDYCRGLTEITLPSQVTNIGEWTFGECSGLTEITLSSNLTRIRERAFSDCSNLASITIPSSVRYIDDYAFYNCSGLKEILIPSSVTSIGEEAFGYCSSLVIYCEKASYAENYAIENNIPYKYIGEKDNQTITAADITKTLGDAAFSLGATTDGDGKLTYKSDNLSVATVDGNGTVTIIGAGTAHITITASETDTYNAATKTITIIVKQADSSDQQPGSTESGTSNQPEKKAQTITAKNITKTYGAKAFSLGAKTNGGGKLTYKVVNTKVATVNTKGKVTIKGCGKTQIKITAAEKGNYKKTTKTITLTVKPKKATITSAKSTKSQTVTVKWKADKTAGGYIIQCATDKNFKKNVKTVTVSKYKTVSKTVTKLKGGKTYYVRVCAYTTANGEKIKGSYSKVLTVKVKK